jgi:hypothetical protein
VRFVVLLALVACKADDPAPSPAPVGSQTGPLADVDGLIPTVDGAKVLQSRARGEGAAMAVWCIDQPDVVDRIRAALVRDGWTDVRTRGKPEQLGIAANRGEARFSARLGVRDAKCAGTLVSVTVMRLGTIDLKPGDKLR